MALSESGAEHLSQNLLAELESQKSKVVGDARDLVASGAIEDKADLGIVNAAATFIENPSVHIEEIRKHATDVGTVLGGYEMQGADLPPAIDAMHAYLLSLQCISRIDYIETWHGIQGKTNQALELAMAQALDLATILSKGYKNNTFLDVVDELKERLGSI